jgi:electron transport complex protein RnfB
MAEQTVAVTTIRGAAVPGVLAIAMCYVLGSASRVFHADVDAKVQAIPEAVAGATRGACRFPGSEQRAEAVAKGEAEVDSV